ncbi:MAG: iron-regulated protein, partial [Myxococcales bacterium]|nr:iron-regulated protein [Myxococcales bacterium]
MIEGYATVVHQGYADARASASALETAIDELLATPSDETLSAARQAWLAARVPYAQTEVFRFYGGPIDVEPGGPEGQLNSWPMDEAYVDYVEGDADAGIINDPVGYPELSAAVLVDANGVGGETYIATGYHAI